MAQSRLSINTKVAQVADWGKTRSFIQRLNPSVIVACVDNMNDRNRIFEIQSDNPTCKVIGRFIDKVHDGAYHTKPDNGQQWLVSPTAFLDAYHELGENGRILYCMNEPSGEVDADTFARLVEWMVEVITLATQRNISLCVLNWGVGHPLIVDGAIDSRLEPVLRLLSAAKGKHYLGIHLYAPADVATRLEATISRFGKLNIEPCSIIVTEFGFDTGFAGDKLNGYKTRGYSGALYAEWERQQLQIIYKPYISAGILEGLCTFIWGDNASWANYNVEPDTDWQKTILAAKDANQLTIDAQAIPPAPYTPEPVTMGEQYIITTPQDYVNLHQDANLTSAVVGKVTNGSTVTITAEAASGGDYFRQLQSGGWFAMQRGQVSLSPYIPPSPTSVTISMPVFQAIIDTLQSQLNVMNEIKKQAK